MPSFRTARRVPFSPEQMFDLVADVERYPEFLPLCEALTVRSRAREGEFEVITADMTAGYKAIRETFASRVRLDRTRLEVATAGVPGAMGPFSRLENRWQFRPARNGSSGTPGGADAGAGCEVDFFIAYELKSAMLQMLVGGLFDRAFRRYTEAFEARARAIYGAGRPAARESS
jgi:coenzyme Q-binding protein COQ10